MKKFLSVLMAMTFLFIAGCSTTSTEHGTKNPSLQSDPEIENNNTVDDKNTGVPPRTSSFKSVEETLDWIQNDEFADCTFKQTVKQLNLDYLLTIESIDDTFELKYIEILHDGTSMNHLFVNEKDERIHLNLKLPSTESNANQVEKYVDERNLTHEKFYENSPKICAGEEVTILEKTRKTYTRDYCAQVKEKETGEITPIYAMFVTDIDGFALQGSLRGSLMTQNWDNKYLNYFEFSMQSINK